MRKFFFVVIQLTILSNVLLQGQWIKGNGSPTHISALYANNEIVVAGSYNDNKVYISMNKGHDWQLRGEIPISYNIRGFATLGNEIYAVTGVGVWKSVDNGVNWKDVNNGITNVNTRAIIVIGEKILVGTYGHGVFRSTNNGDRWYTVNKGLTNLVIRDFTTNGEKLFVATDIGVFVCPDSVINWESASNGLPGSRVLALTNDDINIFAGSGAGVFYSPDNGANWTAVNNGLSNLSIWALTSYENNIFAGIRNAGMYDEYPGGVFLSTNNGSDWNARNEGLTRLDVSHLTINREYIFAADEDGIFYQKLSTLITNIDNNEEILNGYQLNPNYPNPFNPSTKINYSIKNQGFVTLKVFDVLGREISTLINKEQPIGNYEVEFDASNLTSGIYFYRIQAGEFVDIKKMILLR